MGQTDNFFLPISITPELSLILHLDDKNSVTPIFLLSNFFN